MKGILLNQIRDLSIDYSIVLDWRKLFEAELDELEQVVQMIDRVYNTKSIQNN